ncbi:MAG: outer membrane beta-barrel family protein [Tunicatimonas sp.]
MTTYFFTLLKRIFTLCLLLNTGNALAQYQVSGTVQDEQKQPLPFANVLLLSATDSALVKGTVADTTGAYALEVTTNDRYLLSIQMVGYTSYFSDPFGPASAAQQHPPVQLAEATTELGEVVVRSTKPMIEVTSNAIIMNVESSPILQNGTAKQVLEKSPGVVVDQNGNISVKGKSNVLIYLDGKPTYMSNADLMRMLESMPAQNIEKLEIMDNPPAKYDAEGNAGIINIVRTAEAAVGLNGTVGVNLGRGRYSRISPSVQLNYRQNKVNLFGDYSYFYNKNVGSTTLFRRIPNEDLGGVTTFDQATNRLNLPQGHNFRAGADWFLTKQTTLGVLVSGNDGRFEQEENNRTVLGGVYDNPFDGLDANNTTNSRWQNLTYNLNFEQNWKKAGTLSLDLDYVDRTSSNLQGNNNFYFSNDDDPVPPPLLVRTDALTNISIFAAQADYSRSLGKELQLEVGSKLSRVATDNELDFRRIIEGVSVRDTSRSNRFMYDENITAGYVNLNKKWGNRWNAQLGVRGEHTYSQGESLTLDSLVQRDYFNLFPSASASYTIPEQHSFSLSYSRRIDRPDYGNLNPFEFFLDRFTFQRGNPFLNPQYTDAFAFTYGLKNAVFLTLNYNHTTDAITDVLEQENADQTTFQTTVNLNQIKNYSANLSTSLPVAQWWMANLNLTAFYNDVLSPYSEGGVIDNSQFSYVLRAQNTLSLPKEFKLEVTGFYQSPLIWGMFEVGHQYQIDLGLVKEFGRLRAQASLNDIFNWRQNPVTIRQGDISVDVVNKWETRVFQLNLSYRFGNQKVKKARRRGTASDDLQQRAGD